MTWPSIAPGERRSLAHRAYLSRAYGGSARIALYEGGRHAREAAATRSWRRLARALGICAQRGCCDPKAVGPWCAEHGAYHRSYQRTYKLQRKLDNAAE